MVDDLKQFLNHPFSADMSALHWLAFIGFLIGCVVIWNIVLMHIKGNI